MKILMVCLGNICRSPLAEGILRKKLSEKGIENVKVDSAGTSSYHIGQAPDSRSQQNALSHGTDLSSLRARQFGVSDFDDFDKIYVMDSSNYSDVLSLARDASDSEKVELLLNSSHPGSNMAVPDPYFGGENGFENVYQLVDEACDIIANSLDK